MCMVSGRLKGSGFVPVAVAPKAVKGGCRHGSRAVVVVVSVRSNEKGEEEQESGGRRGLHAHELKLQLFLLTATDPSNHGLGS